MFEILFTSCFVPLTFCLSDCTPRTGEKYSSLIPQSAQPSASRAQCVAWSITRSILSSLLRACQPRVSHSGLFIKTWAREGRIDEGWRSGGWYFCHSVFLATSQAVCPLWCLMSQESSVVWEPFIRTKMGGFISSLILKSYPAPLLKY